LQLINPSTSPNELNTTLTPHSIIHGDACFAYFNKIWGIPKNERAAGYALPGVETYSEGKWLTVVYVAVLFISITVVGTVLALAISKTLGHL
jgi:hypothetical protein